MSTKRGHSNLEFCPLDKSYCTFHSILELLSNKNIGVIFMRINAFSFNMNSIFSLHGCSMITKFSLVYPYILFASSLVHTYKFSLGEWTQESNHRTLCVDLKRLKMFECKNFIDNIKQTYLT